VFGGVATIYGPVIAVFVLYPLTEMLATFELFREIRQLIFAGVVLLVLLFMPRGLVPWIRDRMEIQCPRCKHRNSARRQSCRLCAAQLN
jgi:branched-chain amino acid transport system permease protein